MKVKSPPMPSNSRLFANRGNPWSTEREGLQNYGRNAERENPDFDAENFAKKAVERVDRKEKKIKKALQPVGAAFWRTVNRNREIMLQEKYGVIQPKEFDTEKKSNKG